MPEPTDMVPYEPYTASGYHDAREQMVQLCEEISGGTNNPQAKQASLAFFARFERSVRAGLLHAAPDGQLAEQGFAVACREFLREEG